MVLNTGAQSLVAGRRPCLAFSWGRRTALEEERMRKERLMGQLPWEQGAHRETWVLRGREGKTGCKQLP